MEYRGYIAEAKFDEDAHAFYGEILNSHALIHFPGQSVQELEASFHEGVDEYLQVCSEEGIEPERTFSAPCGSALAQICIDRPS